MTVGLLGRSRPVTSEFGGDAFFVFYALVVVVVAAVNHKGASWLRQLRRSKLYETQGSERTKQHRRNKQIFSQKYSPFSDASHNLFRIGLLSGLLLIAAAVALIAVASGAIGLRLAVLGQICLSLLGCLYAHRMCVVCIITIIIIMIITESVGSTTASRHCR